MSLFKKFFRKDSKQDTPNPEYPQINPNTIFGCFVSYFMVITGLLADSQFSKSPVMTELFAAMMSTLEFVSSYYDIDIDDDRSEIIKWFLSPFSALPKNEFKQLAVKTDERLNFYRSRATLGNVRGDFLLDDIPTAKREWPPYRCSVIFCDCIYNPECLSDYDNAPVMINDIFNSVEQVALFITIIREFENYTKKLKTFDM